MATVEECRAALDVLAAKLDAHIAEGNPPVDLNRPMACTVTDLGVHFHGRIAGGRLVDVGEGDDRNAKIRLIAKSDDLLAIVKGDLPIMKAWTSGRITIQANPFDLLKLRKLL
jgi:hypothetical protein